MTKLLLCVLLFLVYTTIPCLAGVNAHQDFNATDFKAKKTKGDDIAVWEALNDRQFVSLGDKKAWIQWNIQVPTDGQYLLAFRHANVIPVDMDIVLNNQAQTTVTFQQTEWGGTWGTTSSSGIPLQLGMNTIVLKPTDGHGGTYVDTILSVEFTGNDGDNDGSGGTESKIVLRSAGTWDHTQEIQGALNRLAPNGTLHLIGDFTIFHTIYFPSNFTWLLEGSITLGKYSWLNKVGWRPGGITEKPDGATNIKMIGGTYYGNRYQNAPDVRFINFVYVENSVFRDMVIESAGDDNFSLGKGSRYNEVHNLVSRYAGGNGLTDKGSYNKWYDCVAEFCDSDGWTPKSKSSEYHRCVARENEGPGFGLYARTDQEVEDLGAKLNNNSFIEIEAYCNKRSGISFNIAKNCGPGAELNDNLVKGFFYRNGRSGVEFTNMLADGKIVNNPMDVVAIENYGWGKATRLAGISVKVGGLAVPGTRYAADQISGEFIGFGNNFRNNTDVNIAQATNSYIRVYQANTAPRPVVFMRGNVQSFGISCPARESDEWRVKKYCEAQSQPNKYLCVTKWNYPS